MNKRILKLITLILIVVSISSCKPEADCTNGIKDGDETSIDCGGSCPACPTCSDGIMNGTETDIDCGGDCDDCAVYGESMHGKYIGTITGDLLLVFPPALTIDTTFVSPGIPSEIEISPTTYSDSLSINLKMTVAGAPINITVLGHIDSDETFTIPPTIYTYLGAIPIKVNGNGAVSGNNLNANVILSESDGTMDSISGDLDFAGTK